MQVLSNIMIFIEFNLSNILYYPNDDILQDNEMDLEGNNIETPRIFPALNSQYSSFLSRLKSLVGRFLPPPPPRWMKVLFVIWMAWCWLTKSIAPLLIGHDKIKIASEKILLWTM